MRTSTSSRLVLQPLRYTVALAGRLLVDGEQEQSCVLEFVDGREAYISVSTPGDIGPCGRAIGYFDLVGRIEGLSVRLGPDRLMVTLSAPDTKWARLRKQFAVLSSTSAADRENLRGHRRIIPDTLDIEILLLNGNSTAAIIRDVSRSGAAIETNMPVSVGDRMILGATRGQVVRSFSGGFAIQFMRLLPLEQFGSSFRL